MGLRKVCDQYRPYSNCVTLKGQLTNWTSEDIVEVATKNIDTIIEPIRSELEGETNWSSIDDSQNSGDTGNQDGNQQGDDYEWGTIE